MESLRTPDLRVDTEIHTVAVVDDQVDIRELLQVRIGMVPGLNFVGHGATGSEAISLASKEADQALEMVDNRLVDQLPGHLRLSADRYSGQAP